jgi:hypothetical protein
MSTRNLDKMSAPTFHHFEHMLKKATLDQSLRISLN